MANLRQAMINRSVFLTKMDLAGIGRPFSSIHVALKGVGRAKWHKKRKVGLYRIDQSTRAHA